MTVNLKSFKSKIFTIVLIPIISIIYFTFYYVKLSNSNINTITSQKENILLVDKLIDVVHNLQIEQDLAVHFVNSQKSQNLQENFTTAYKNSDTSIKLLETLRHENKDSYLQNLPALRLQVLDQNLSFDQVLQAYTRINNNTINVIKYLLPKVDENRYDALFLINLELLKESAGLERACIYNDLLTPNSDLKCKNTLLYLQQDQKNRIDDLSLYSNGLSESSYKKYVDKQNIEELDRFRKLYKQHKLKKEDAIYWYEVSTNNINTYNKVSKDILNKFIINLDDNYRETMHNLNIAMILWIVSIISGVYFIFLINKLFKEHEKHADDLELSSRTLDSYEGIVITDKDTHIIKVNKGFERITGYSAEDAIGKKTSILKSGNNPKSLYKAMWGSVNSTGSWTGEVINKRKDGKLYSQRLSISAFRDKEGNVKNYIGHLFDITELRKAQQEAVYQASHDALTKLINRTHLLTRMREELNRSKRHGFKNAFLFIDLDNFKNVNDSFGHHVGDKLLIHVAEALKSSVRECDIVARLSGDEFAVVLLDIDSSYKKLEDVIEFVAYKILNQLNHEIIIDSNKVKVGSSIGVRVFPKDHLDEEDQIIKDADSAMYKAKNGGKNRFVVYQG
ncbi:diguanylate cyclase [Sulfurimonas sp. C5]|uniref:diguanylate cyclase domain-containing protein n=1 Tax=Sulfurimonas sp. C5 TaxID=3036947 RepID=UPI002458DD2D|nr:diguanylate cyclase [Sulfurimonas sp. C5]MDH4944256.1 diguanylate cyclase [Sulfurimonas sp. C5]